ncbi:MAG TPA: hypothetical protein DCF45_07660 [Gammaproteobacteria bacterium]|nr:hypothetical protein [Gammaproteobacteria bacterium]
MNFFEHQLQARRQSKLLILLFLLAVTLIVAAVNFVAAFGYLYGASEIGLAAPAAVSDLGVGFFLPTSLVVIAVVFGATLWKLSQLARGGHVVAEMLGGERVDPGTHNPLQSRLINIVEEMAIASGTPAPPVYLIDSPGINAFAAGFSPNQAVIGVTSGCIELLSRDELQGVIAHEFSHILNGDMRLNMRLIGVLHGIMIIGLLGQALMRGTFKRSRYRYRYLDSDPARRRSAGGAPQTFLVGAALMVVGYLGFFLGNLIKAAVSRQREYLADASAVQFTRNADGIANALRKIRLHIGGARIDAPNSEQLNHIFFGEALSAGFAGWLSTHPRLEQRIRRIKPHFPIDHDPLPGVGVEYLQGADPIPDLSAFVAGATTEPGNLSAATATVAAGDVVELIGKPGEQQLARAVEIHRAIPQSLLDQLHSQRGARALCLSLLLSGNNAIQQLQLECLRAELRGNERADDNQVTQLVAQIAAMGGQLQRLSDELRLPLLDIALPVLSMIPVSQIRAHLRTMRAVMLVSQQVELRQYVIFAICRAQLLPSGDRVARHRSLQKVIAQVMIVTAIVARAGHDDEAEAEAAFLAAMNGAGVADMKLPAVSKTGIGALEKSLRELTDLALMPKMKLVEVLATAILHDDEVRIDEREILRAICEILDCPLPPLSS